MILRPVLPRIARLPSAVAICCLSVGLSMLACPARGDDRNRQSPWEAAEEAIQRLSPSSFSELPADVVQILNDGGCLIPQVPGLEGASNVIRGEFVTAGESGWAVLCSVEGASSIWVFDSENRHVAELRPVQDRDYLQGVGSEEIAYSRALAAVDPARIRRYHEAGRAGMLDVADRPDLTHAGIEDRFLGKASTILYFTGHEWITLPGAD